MHAWPRFHLLADISSLTDRQLVYFVFVRTYFARGSTSTSVLSVETSMMDHRRSGFFARRDVILRRFPEYLAHQPFRPVLFLLKNIQYPPLVLPTWTPDLNLSWREKYLPLCRVLSKLALDCVEEPTGTLELRNNFSFSV